MKRSNNFHCNKVSSSKHDRKLMKGSELLFFPVLKDRKANIAQKKRLLAGMYFQRGKIKNEHRKLNTEQATIVLHVVPSHKETL